VDQILTAQDDEVVIGKARRGDRDAFRVLVERHSRAVFRLAFRMTGSEIDAEDMVQETFLKAWKQIGKFDGRATFGTWLHRICANCSLDHIRARQRKQGREAVSRGESDSSGTDPLMQAATPAPSPERLALSSQISAILVPALADLSAMERAAFVLRHFEGQSIEEISRALGLKANAAKHSVFRAVRKMRLALEPFVEG
jgi:RNA polymerase sigma-70 factor (ECF subfamily)